MASIAFRMKLYSQIMTDTFFTIPADSRLVATRSWRPCRDSFIKCLEKGDYKTDYMQYGSHSQMFMIAIADDHILKVLRPNGQPSSRTGSEIFQ